MLFTYIQLSQQEPLDKLIMAAFMRDHQDTRIFEFDLVQRAALRYIEEQLVTLFLFNTSSPVMLILQKQYFPSFSRWAGLRI